MITKLVMHYEYFARNEARYEARNAPVCGAEHLRLAVRPHVDGVLVAHLVRLGRKVRMKVGAIVGLGPGLGLGLGLGLGPGSGLGLGLGLGLGTGSGSRVLAAHLEAERAVGKLALEASPFEPLCPLRRPRVLLDLVSDQGVRIRVSGE